MHDIKTGIKSKNVNKLENSRLSARVDNITKYQTQNTPITQTLK